MGVNGSPPDPVDIAQRFRVEGSVAAVTPVPGGHINDSYRVRTRPDRAETARSYLLQRLNPTVFNRPQLVMENVGRVARHLVRHSGRYPALIPSLGGADWISDASGVLWRMFAFVEGAELRLRVHSLDDARAAGRAFGEFLRLVADLTPPLHETIPGFHDTTARFDRLIVAVRTDARQRAKEAQPDIDAMLAQRAYAERLPPLIASGAVPIRSVHNDAKIANVLFDERSGEPLCVIDLDTVMPGSALFDFGDLVRSSTSLSSEDETDLSQVGVRVELFAALARGYLESAGRALTGQERGLLGFAGRLITLEQAVRFLTDHLEGDRYYRIARPGHNLIRCRAQMALFRSLTEQAETLERIIMEAA